MRRLLPALAILALGLGLGTLAGIAYAESDAAPPAYVLVAGRVLDPDGLEAYGEAAGPLAQAAGIEILARQQDVQALHVLEGKWPYGDGFLTVERFRSMEALLKFWNSPGYQEAIKLREGKVELDFVVALEALPATESGSE